MEGDLTGFIRTPTPIVEAVLRVKPLPDSPVSAKSSSLARSSDYWAPSGWRCQSAHEAGEEDVLADLRHGDAQILLQFDDLILLHARTLVALVKAVDGHGHDPHDGHDHENSTRVNPC